MNPDPSALLEIAGIRLPLIGFYDAPDASAFRPLVAPSPAASVCVFAFYRQWLEGATLHITRENFGCGGAGRSLCGVTTMPHEEFITFLADEEGLKASRELMARWIDAARPYEQEHSNILIGPLREGQSQYLKSVTFLVNPDQLALLMTGAQYHSGPDDPPPVLAPFGSGCMQLVSVFGDLDRPQAVVGATDIAMRRYVPPEILLFTVTKPMFEQLCALDERSFLYKPFWKRLVKARAKAGA
jgi:hypothetical protein